LDVFIDGFAYFSVFPHIIYDHFKCVSRLRATLYFYYTNNICVYTSLNVLNHEGHHLLNMHKRTVAKHLQISLLRQSHSWLRHCTTG